MVTMVVLAASSAYMANGVFFNVKYGGSSDEDEKAEGVIISLDAPLTRTYKSVGGS